MKKVIYKCEKCEGEISDSDKFCTHCGSQLMDSILVVPENIKESDLKTSVTGKFYYIDKEGMTEPANEGESKKDFIKRLKKLGKKNNTDACKAKGKKKIADAGEDAMLGSEDPTISFDPTDAYQAMIEDIGATDVNAFFGSEKEFTGMVDEIVNGENMTEAEAVDALMQMFYQFMEDPEGFMAEMEAPVEDSVSTNKKARYVVDQLVKIPGVTHGKAVALLAYHGSMKNIRAMKDSKSLLKFKYLKDVVGESTAKNVVDYFAGKKTLASSPLNYDSVDAISYAMQRLNDSAEFSEKKTYNENNIMDAANQYKQGGFSKVVYKCESCSGEISDSDKFCTHCGSQLMDATQQKTYDVFFNDDDSSNNLGFKKSLKYCKDYIKQHNGTKHLYFADYKGGSVSVVCNETGDMVYETTVK
jgi:hypothetical protein